MFDLIENQELYQGNAIRLLERNEGTYWLREEKNLIEQFNNIRHRKEITGYVKSINNNYFTIIPSPFLDQITIVCKAKDSSLTPSVGSYINLHGKYIPDTSKIKFNKQSAPSVRNIYQVSDYNDLIPITPKAPLEINEIADQLFAGDWSNLPLSTRLLVATEFISSPPIGKISGGLWIGLGHAIKQAQAYKFFPSFLRRHLPKEFTNPNKADIKRMKTNPFFHKVLYNFKTKQIRQNSIIKRPNTIRESCGIGTAKKQYYENNWDTLEKNVDSAILLNDDFRVPGLVNQNRDPVPEIIQTLIAHLFKTFKLTKTIQSGIDSSEYTEKAMKLLISYGYDSMVIKPLNPSQFMDNEKLIRLSGMMARNQDNRTIQKDNIKEAMKFQLENYYQYVESFHDQVRSLKIDDKIVNIELRQINHPIMRKIIRIFVDRNSQNLFVSYPKFVEWLLDEKIRLNKQFKSFEDILDKMILHNILNYKIDPVTGIKLYKINEFTLEYGPPT